MQHYTTSLLVWKYLLGDLVSEKWHMYKFIKGSKTLFKKFSLKITNRFGFLHVAYFYMLNSGLSKSLQELHG